MNLEESADGATSDVFFASFNERFGELAIGSKNVFSLFSLKTVEELFVLHGILADDVRIIDINLRSFKLALVTVSAPRTVKILDIPNQQELRRYKYPDTILAVKLNRSHLAVCLEECLYICNIQNLNVEYIILGTPPNPLGLCIVSQNDEKNFLAYPGSSSNGEVKIYDTFNYCSMGTIAAHKNRLAAMAFNNTGTKIATASDMDTSIRVFDVIKKTKLYEFRLDDQRCARIYSLCFSLDSNYLSSSSNTEIVHIFRLHDMREASAEEPQGLLSYLTNVITGLLTQGRIALTSMLYGDRDFATVRLPFSGIRNICALPVIHESLRVLIVSGQRILYIYNVDSVNGGECVLEHTYNLSENWCTSIDNRPFQFFCVEGVAQHQESPRDAKLSRKVT